MINTNLPIYEIQIDLDDPNTFVDFNSLVHDPAHEISFETFSKTVRFEFNDDERTVSGVAISADTPIYRRDDSGEYYVVFTKKAIKDIIHDYARNNRFNNVNIEHNSKDIAEGVFMIGSYQVDTEKGFTAPERFKDVSNGSWITTYKFENEELYQRVKSGEVSGFSIEGTFVMDEAQFKSVVTFETILDELIELAQK
tara:strand:- start:710 stop:1300 length:591 start_codon:yes stop_codon:yes gene_type:complete